MVHHRLVLGCHEHWRAGTAAGRARAATGGTFRHVPAADAKERRPAACLTDSQRSVRAADPAKPLLTSPQASHHRPALRAHGCSSRQRGSVPAFPVCRFSCSVYRQQTAGSRQSSCRPGGIAVTTAAATTWCSGAVSTGALVLRLDVHALQQEVLFGTCCLLLTQGATAGCCLTA